MIRGLKFLKPLCPISPVLKNTSLCYDVKWWTMWNIVVKYGPDFGHLELRDKQNTDRTVDLVVVVVTVPSTVVSNVICRVRVLLHILETTRVRLNFISLLTFDRSGSLSSVWLSVHLYEASFIVFTRITSLSSCFAGLDLMYPPPFHTHTRKKIFLKILGKFYKKIQLTPCENSS